MKNFKMIVSYDGTRYFGWEHQPDTDMTIQGKLEKVLSQMQEMPEGQSVTVIGAGRTDAGVHARAMTCNVLLDTEKTEYRVTYTAFWEDFHFFCFCIFTILDIVCSVFTSCGSFLRNVVNQVVYVKHVTAREDTIDIGF